MLLLCLFRKLSIKNTGCLCVSRFLILVFYFISGILWRVLKVQDDAYKSPQNASRG